jgi:hypothetical protein
MRSVYEAGVWASVASFMFLCNQDVRHTIGGNNILTTNVIFVLLNRSAAAPAAEIRFAIFLLHNSTENAVSRCPSVELSKTPGLH